MKIRHIIYVLALLNFVALSKGLADRFPYYQQKLHPSIQEVVTPKNWAGTGFLLSYSGHKFFVTAAHICEDSTVILSKLGRHDVILSDAIRDTCVTTIRELPDAEFLQLASWDAKEGQEVYTIGFPEGLYYDYREGTIIENDTITIQYDVGQWGSSSPCPDKFVQRGDKCIGKLNGVYAHMWVRSGNSGGPVINKNGKVIGLVSIRANMGAAPLGGFMPASEIRISLEKAIKILEGQ